MQTGKILRRSSALAGTIACACILAIGLAGCGAGSGDAASTSSPSIDFAVAGGATAVAPPSGSATGTQYVSFWSGDLRIFADQADTQVTLIDLDTGGILSLADPRINSVNVATNPFVLAASDSFEGIGGLGGINDEIRVRIIADDATGGGATKPVIVWTGSLQFRHPTAPPPASNPWASYVPAITGVAGTNGQELGVAFLGFTTSELMIFARVGTTATSIQIDDVATNTDADTDDTYSLTAASSELVFADTEIEVYSIGGFEDDTLRIASNVDLSVIAGHSITLAPDWTISPPSYAAGDDGSELGTLFYTFATQYLTVFPTEDGTTVTITDLSDGDDSRSLFLAEGDDTGDYELVTPTLLSSSHGIILPRPSGPAVTIHDNGGNAFDNDLVKVSSDKPILVYAGPVGSNTQEYADVAYSVPTGPDSRIIYVFAQNSGSSNDLQILGFDPDTIVTITSLSQTQGFRGNGQHDFVIGPGLSGSAEPWKEGQPGSDVWWGSDVWNAEILRITSTKPITVIGGDYDSAHFGAYIPFVLATPTLPPTAIAVADLVMVCRDDVINLDGSGSFDADTVPGGLTPTYEWDFDIAVDSDGDTIPDNDVDATGAMTMVAYPAVGVYTLQLTYTDDDGESDTDFVQITVDACTQPPTAVAIATPDTACVDDDITLDGSGSFDNDMVMGASTPVHEWDLDIAVDSDGDTIPDNDVDATGAVVMTSYPAPGVYTVRLTYTDDDDESDTADVVITIDTCTLPPTAVAFSDPEPACVATDVTLDGSGSFDNDTWPGGMTPMYEWDLDIAVDSDGDTVPDNDVDATGAVVVTQYPAPGVYTARLTFTDDDGETDTADVVITASFDGCLCPHTQGYWKNHPEDWAVTDLVLGSELYSMQELLDIYAMPVRGDASLNLAHQLITAKLNVAAGAPDVVATTIADADALLAAHAGKLPYDVRSSTAEGQLMVAAAAILDDYNNQNLTPGCSF